MYWYVPVLSLIFFGAALQVLPDVICYSELLANKYDGLILMTELVTSGLLLMLDLNVIGFLDRRDR